MIIFTYFYVFLNKTEIHSWTQRVCNKRLHSLFDSDLHYNREAKKPNFDDHFETPQ